jgi:hypothetical protein
MTVNINTIVSSQLPEFVREDYPAFTQFLEAYYKFLAQDEGRILEDTTDIDRSADAFVEYFKNSLNVYGESNYPYIDNALFTKKIKQLYTAKGSEPAIKFLFKVLFNKEAQVSYPWDQVLKASDGKWQQETSIFVSLTSGQPNTLVGKRVYLYSQNVKIAVYVTRTQEIRPNVYELFIDKNYYGTISVGDALNYDGVNGTVIATTTGYVIEKPGSGYKVGDLITGTTVIGSIEVDQLLKVTAVNNNGGITRLSIVKFNAGYSDQFFLLTSKQSTLNQSTIELRKNGSLQFSIPDESNLDKYRDYGYIIDPNYWDVPYSNPTYTGTLIREFFEQTPNNQGDVSNFALIRFKIGAVARYQGYYTSNDGFLDDVVKIQDSYYYQRYSYLITLDERLQDYKAILKSYLHTAGTALFAEYQIQNTYKPGISGSISVDEYISKATFRTRNKSIINQYVSADDQGGRIRIDPYDAEQYFLEDTYNPETYQTFTG